MTITIPMTCPSEPVLSTCNAQARRKLKKNCVENREKARDPGKNPRMPKKKTEKT